MSLTLFPGVGDEQALKEFMAYERHVRGEYDFTIPVEPMPTPRPRSRVANSRGGQPVKPYVLVYQEPDYMTYKKEIAVRLKDARLGLSKGDYSMILVGIYLPYPASTPQKSRIPEGKHRKKPDWDNFIKGFQDALGDAGILLNGDGALSDGAVRKRYTTAEKGFISFTLI